MKYKYNKAQRKGFIKKKLIFFVLGGVVICALAVSGVVLLVHKYDKSSAAKYSNDPGVTSDSSDGSSSGGLQVDNDPSAATNLGQLQSTSTSQGNSVNNSSTSSTQSSLGTNASTNASSAADPTTFAQYNKYATSSSALFGDIQVGTGAAISVGQTATVSYKGWLTNGTLFAQSDLNSSGQVEATSFVIGQHQVIAGLEEGVAGMKVGGTRLIIVPPSLGYGSTGKGPVPANAVLVFEVSLLDVH